MDVPTIYCEQLIYNGSQYLNIFTNIIFILLGILAYYVIYKKQNKVKRNELILIILFMAIGIGSFMWHSTPSKLSDLADTISIILFALTSLMLITNKLINQKILRWLSIPSILGVALYLERLPYLNGSLVYVLLLLLLVYVSASLFRNKKYFYKYFKNASIFFILGIIARTIDIQTCEVLSTGTHFLWHMFVATMGYYIIIGISEMYDLKNNTSDPRS